MWPHAAGLPAAPTCSVPGVSTSRACLGRGGGGLVRGARLDGGQVQEPELPSGARQTAQAGRKEAAATRSSVSLVGG